MPLDLGVLKFFESVCVRVCHDELSLSVNETSGKGTDMGAFFGNANVGKKLIGGIPQPHGLDISSYYVCGFVARSEVVAFDGGFEGVRVRFLKYFEQPRLLNR